MKKSVLKPIWKYLLIEVLAAILALVMISGEQMRDRLYEAEIYGSSIAANIELTLNQYVSIVESLGDQYLEYGDRFADYFSGVCSHIMRRDDAIGSLYIAPDGVIQLAYPLEVNEATIGFEPAKDPEQGAATRFAIESKKTTVAGPHALVEGGTGFIVRYPIYDDADQFRGLAILVMDWDRFVEKVTEEGNGQKLYNYAAWKENNEGVLTDENGFIFCAGDVRERRVLLRINAPNENWYLTVEEEGGWGSFRQMLPWYLGALALIGILTYIEASVLRRREDRKQMEMAEAESRAKQKELEDRLALQEKLMQQERQQKELNSMITAMASDYRSVYHVDIDSNDAVCYRADPEDPGQTPEGVHFPYLERFTWYCDHYVDPDYRDGFRTFIDPDNVRRVLATKNIMVYRYLVHRDGTDYYEMLRMAGVRHPADRDDHIVHAVGLGFTVIDAEIREAMARNRALQDALAAAEDANKAKIVFLSNMSHEIRTPMNAIIGLNNIALNDPGLSAATREHLEKIGSSARHLLGIINDILDMSRIESGRMLIRNEEFSFDRMMEQVNTMIGGQCREKGLEYVCQREGETGEYLIGDDMKLRQVLINILGNAIKFTPAGGKVTLLRETVARLDGKATLRFTISDTGIGMSSEYLPKIFDAFSQEDASAVNQYGSTGLGMPITKSIVELMNGTIEVESEKGVGTTFVVTVTLLEADRKKASGWETETSEEQSSDAAEEDILKGRRVLLAEDVAINAEIIMMLLSMREMEVEHAENGRIAVEMFSRHEAGYYAAILMDMRMPEMTGLEAARAIRAMDREDAGTIPIIALTANAFDEDVQRSMQAGLNAHLSKPVEPEVLFETLERMMGGKGSAF